MKKTFDFAGRPTERTLTLKCLRDAKGRKKFAQTTATTVEQAAAARAAGIEMLIGPADLLPTLRQGAPDAFITIGVHMWQYPLVDQVLTRAYQLMEAGADAIYCPREPSVVEVLAEAKVPVMGHLGLVPRTSSWTGGIRAMGRTAEEAMTLLRQFKDLENAGAVIVEAEVIAAPALAAITPRVGLSVISLGSGPAGDIDYLFQEDICGETPNRPRHARAFADLYGMQQEMDRVRREALTAYRAAVDDESHPAADNTVGMRRGEEEALQDMLAGL